MSDNAGQNRTPKKRRPALWEKAFIAALADSGVVSSACAAAEVARSTVYEQRKNYEDFAAAWDNAIEIAADALEAEIRRRALEGVQEPIYYKGVLVDHVRKYSDTLAMFILKATRPQKYRERVEHSTDPEKPFVVKVIGGGARMEDL